MATVSSSTSTTTSTATSSYTTSSSAALNTEALVTAAVNQRLQAADRLTVKSDTATAKIAAYKEMQTLVQAVTDSLENLRNAPGTVGQAADLFNQTTAYLTTDGTKDASDILGVTTDSSAVAGSYELIVSKLAQAHKVSSTTQTSSTDDLGLSGSFSLNNASGTATTFAVTSDMSLADLAEEINNSKATTGVQASIMTVGDGDYRLVLTSTSTGQAISASDTSGTVLQTLGVLDGTGAFANELLASQDAEFSIDGVTFTRDTNDIDDAIEGVTLNLYGAASTQAVTVTVGSDLSGIKTAIQEFVTAYNAYRDFVATNQATAADGTAAEDAVLFGDSLLRSTTRTLADALSTTVDGGSLATLGLSLDNTGQLALDEDTLDNVLLTDIDAVKSLLQFNMTTNSSKLKLLDYTNATTATNFTLDIVTDTTGNITSVSVGGNTSLFTFSGKTITGATGSIYEGLKVVFTGSSSSSIDVTLSQGLAAKLYNETEMLADITSGTIQNTIDDLQERVDEYAEKIADIQDKAADYKERLTMYYAKLESKIEMANALVEQLKSLYDATYSSNS